MIGFRKYWYGKECEGRLTDVETLFIADISVKGLDMEKMPHIYFCSTAVYQIIKGDITNNVNIFIWLSPHKPNKCFKNSIIYYFF